MKQMKEKIKMWIMIKSKIIKRIINQHLKLRKRKKFLMIWNVKNNKKNTKNYKN